MRLPPNPKQIVVWVGTVHSSVEHPDPAYWEETNAEIRRTFHALYQANECWKRSVRRGDVACARRWRRTVAHWQRKYQIAHLRSHMRDHFLGWGAMLIPAMKHPDITYLRWRNAFIRQLPRAQQTV